VRLLRKRMRIEEVRPRPASRSCAETLSHGSGVLSDGLLNYHLAHCRGMTAPALCLARDYKSGTAAW